MHVFRLKNLVAGLVALFLALGAALWLVARDSRPHQSGAAVMLELDRPVILDAGHGGLDGGAVAKGGVSESCQASEAGINLAITLRAQGLLEFFGVPTLLTRSDEQSLDYSPGASVRQNKNADLQARLGIAQAWPDSPFLSIHLNSFTQARYSGAQVFYGPGHGDGRPLAEALQHRLQAVLAPENNRQAKPAPEGVYLMRHITAPAVTIECGFLSNPREAELLAQPEYQTQTALAIAVGYMDFLKAEKSPPDAP